MNRPSAAKGLSIVAAAGASALFMYFLDPDQGRRRRALVRDKVNSGLNRLDNVAGTAGVDMGHRLRGRLAMLRGRFSREPVTDDVLTERVRARLGRLTSHSGAIEASVQGGRVTLSGPVLRKEYKRLLRGIRWTAGVRAVEDRLTPYQRPGNVSALQGHHQTDAESPGNWSPVARVAAGMTGGALAAYGLIRRPTAAPLLILGGIALLARSASNLDIRRLTGRQGRRGIDFTKTLHIEAPVDRVFSFWSNFENFPRFMRNVRSVRKSQDDSWHWTVAGPLGTSVEWDSRVTQYIPGQVIAWASKEGSAVEHAGIVRFQPHGSGTHLHIRMSYHPPAGALGHAVATLFGADPQSEMDQDLMRVKAFFEGARPARDAAQAPAQFGR